MVDLHFGRRLNLLTALQNLTAIFSSDLDQVTMNMVNDFVAELHDSGIVERLCQVITSLVTLPHHSASASLVAGDAVQGGVKSTIRQDIAEAQKQEMSLAVNTLCCLLKGSKHAIVSFSLCFLPLFCFFCICVFSVVASQLRFLPPFLHPFLVDAFVCFVCLAPHKRHGEGLRSWFHSLPDQCMAADAFAE